MHTKLQAKARTTPAIRSEIQQRGVKIMANISGKRYARMSIIAGLHNNAMIAPLVFKGYCDTQVVTTKEASII